MQSAWASSLAKAANAAKEAAAKAASSIQQQVSTLENNSKSGSSSSTESMFNTINRYVTSPASASSPAADSPKRTTAGLPSNYPRDSSEQPLIDTGEDEDSSGRMASSASGMGGSPMRSGSTTPARSLLDDGVGGSTNDANLTAAEIQERLVKNRALEAKFQGIWKGKSLVWKLLRISINQNKPLITSVLFLDLLKAYRSLQKKNTQIETVLKANTPIEQLTGPNDLVMLESYIIDLKSKGNVSSVNGNAAFKREMEREEEEKKICLY